VTRLSTVLERIDVRQPGADLPLLSVSQTRGVLRRSELSDKPPRAESLDAYKVVRCGDIVFNKMSIRAGALGVASEDGLATYHYEVMRPVNGADARFLVYLMKSDWLIGELIARERGIGAGDTSASVRTTEVPFKILRTIEAHLPSPAAQSAIADYLDRETARIDTLIAKQEQLIATLRERRQRTLDQSIVSSSVQAMRLSRIAQITDCLHVTAEFVDDNTYPVASIQECQGPVVDLTHSRNTTQEYFNLLRSGGRVPRPHDLLFIRNVSVGLVSRVTDEVPDFAVGQETVLIRPRGGVDSRFLRHSFMSTAVREQINLAMIGSTFRRLNVSALAALRLPSPTLEQQRLIADALDQSLARIDTLIAKAERFIELSKERRAALITAAVTGQLEIPSET